MFGPAYILLAGAVLVAPVGTARAMEDGGDVNFPDASCGESFVPTKQIARAATEADVYGYNGEPDHTASLSHGDAIVFDYESPRPSVRQT